MLRNRKVILRVVKVGFVAALLILVPGCGPTMKVTRIGVDEQVDLSGNWNDTDSRLVSTEMINNCLNAVWLSEFNQEVTSQTGSARKPVVVVGRVYNNTDEHINPGTFLNDIEMALVNSNQVKVVTNAQFRNELQKEQKYQNNGAVDPNMAARVGKQIGADFILFGDISKVRDRWEGKEVVLYKIKLELNNVTTSEKSWIGMKDIKKFKNQKTNSW